MIAGVVQLTDPHIGATWQRAAPLDTLRAVVAAVRALPDRPQAVIVTGDLTNDGTPEQYTQLAEVLGELRLPVHVLPGNHDGRAALRGAFDVPGEGEQPIQYAVELDGIRVLMLDTMRSGEPGGVLGPDRLTWLVDELSGGAQTPTLLAMHHPPFVTGLAGMDAIGLAEVDRVALSTLLDEHPHVCGLVAGHVHRAMTAMLAGRPAMTIPSTYCQSPLDLTRPDLPMAPEPVGFALHVLVEGRLVSHLQTLSLTAA